MLYLLLEPLRSGIPDNDVREFLGSLGRVIGEVRDSSVEDQRYTVETTSVTMDGLKVVMIVEQVDGTVGMSSAFSIVKPTFSSSASDLILTLAVKGSIGDPETVLQFSTLFAPSSTCLSLSRDDDLSYSDGQLTVMDAVYPNIEHLHRLDLFGLHTFEGSAPIESTETFTTRSICINPRDGYAYFTDEHSTGHDSIVTEFMSIRSMLRAPVIKPSQTSTVVTRRGLSFQIGTTLAVQEGVYSVTFDCGLETGGVPSSVEYEWIRDGAVIPDDYVKYRFSTARDWLTIVDIDNDDEGNYTCIVSNGFDSDSAASEVTITKIPTTTPTVTSSPGIATGAIWIPQGFTTVCLKKRLPMTNSQQESC